MLGKLGALKDKVHGYVDQAQEKVAAKLVEKLHPQVHEVIDGRVDKFRDETLEALPRQCEDGLKARTGSSSVAWLVDKILGDNTDVLVEKLLSHFKPGVVSATDGLSATAAEQIMDKLKGWLDGKDEEIKAAAGPEADAAAASVQMEQLQVAEGEDAPAAAAPEEGEEAAGPPLEEPAGDGAEEAPAAGGGRRGLRSSAMSAAAALAGGLFGLDGQLPNFEDAARELVHPLFEKLKAEVWDLVPGALQESLAGLVGDKEEHVDDAAVEGDEGGVGSWMSRVSNKLQGKAGHLVDKVAAATLDAIDGPMQTAINQLVDDLEHSSTAAAFKEIRRMLADYKLISADAAA